MSSPNPVVDPWNPRKYERFRVQRSRPFYDLLALVRPKEGMRVVDLGCGTGELTRELHDRLKAEETIGIDKSPAMLARSGAYATERLRFLRGDIAEFRPGAPIDLIFANASLQWLDHHPELLRKLLYCLAPEGQIAVQMPANHEHPTHVIAAEMAEEAEYNGALAGFVRRPPTLDPEEYALILHRGGCREQHVRLQVYDYYLESREAVLDWADGTLLTPYQERLPEGLYHQFTAEYRRRLLPLLDREKPYFYPFKRLLLWGLL